MINRIISIKNVGRFKNCAANGDVTFRPYTLMFGENARGKTTLCAILRSLVTNDHSLVIGRTTLGSTAAPEVRFLTSEGNIQFQDGTWNAAYPDIAVFDATYISKNVYAGDAVDTEQRRSLYRVIIGAQGVAWASYLNDLEVQIRNKNNTIRDNRNQIQRYLSHGMSVDVFVDLQEDEAIDVKISARELELQAAQQAEQLQRREILTAVKVPVFPTAFAELLGKTLENVAEDAEQRVNEHITRHKMETRGESWINEGLEFVVDDTCPFCDQNITKIPLVRDFISFFSHEYRALRDEVNRLKAQFDTVVGERVAMDIERLLAQNAASAEYWQQYCEFTVPVLAESGRIEGIVGELREAAQSLLTSKADTPLEAIAPDEDFTRSLEAFEILRTSFGVYNEEVATVNAIITQRKDQAQVANVRDLETALIGLRARKDRYTEEVNELCISAVRLQGEKSALEREKTTVRQQLDTHTQQVISQYGQRINWYLERINASFRITTPTFSYRGGSPSTSYQIIINGNSVEIGDPQTPADQPSFRNTLSAGDRTTLALAFFLAQLEQDASRNSKVVVFDDPFGSMDSFRRNHTVHQIYRCGESCAQTIVLSHDPNFLHLLWDRIAPSERKSLCMTRIGEENTTIAEWDIEQAILARYHEELDTLQKYMSLNEGNRGDVIQKIRPVLEAYCRNLYPVQFVAQDMLGNMIAKIRNDSTMHPLAEILDDLDEINTYCRRYHHADNPNAATEPVDDAELLGYVRRTLKVVGCLL